MNAITHQFATTQRRINEIDLCAWIGQAAPGDVLEYHRGFLALDTARGSQLAETERAELVRLGRRAFWAAEQGLIHLVQRRHKADDYSYLAIARAKLKNASTLLMTLLPEAA